jgi:flagella basal body P-ring formation protein FlgA
MSTIMRNLPNVSSLALRSVMWLGLSVSVSASVLLGSIASAQTAPVSQVAYRGADANRVDVDFLNDTQRWLDQALTSTRSKETMPLRMEVSVGSLDSRLQLAPCSRVEPYLPPGTRLWGKTRLGLRCTDGQVKWNVFLPVTIKATGPAWVVKRDVASGAVISEADLTQAEVDWAQDSSPVIADIAQAAGQVATRPLSTGQTLRQNMVRAAQVFQAGAQVRVLAVGAGYQITSDGQALAAGVVGQQTRVRMDSGRIMTALVLDARTVRLEL